MQLGDRRGAWEGGVQDRDMGRDPARDRACGRWGTMRRCGTWGATRDEADGLGREARGVEG